MKTVYLLLGSNVGNRARYLSLTRREIKSWHRTKLIKASSVWETAPVGYLEQRRFLNQAVKIETELSPLAVLFWAKKTEVAVGRRRRFIQGPREIDIDLLLYGNKRLKLPLLSVPHPRLQDRLFALAALSQLAPRMMIPGTREKVQDACQRLQQQASALAAVRVS